MRCPVERGPETECGQVSEAIADVRRVDEETKALRLCRVMRLMRTWRGLYTIVTTFGKAIAQMMNLLG